MHAQENPLDMIYTIDLIYTKEKPCGCKICYKNFATPATVKRHIKIVQTGTKQYKCNQCDYSNEHFDLLVKHEMKHRGRKPYK